MFLSLRRVLTYLVNVLLLLGFPANATADLRPNVLFIAVDDLRPELSCYGDRHIHSPNIDALAASGRRFERAYCQQALCNPSRTSLMTGMRPDSIGVTGNHAHFRDKHPDVVTLPQHFRQHGYHAAAIGKIYHGLFPDGASNTKWDTMGDPASWSVPAIRFGPRYYYTDEGIAAAKTIFRRVYQPTDPGPDDWTRKLVFGPATESPDVPDNTLYDGKVADVAVRTLQELQSTNTPFFLAVGFIKPHSPYIAPLKYFELYNDVDLPSHPQFPIGAPSFAGHTSGELRRYTDQPKHGELSDNNQKRVRQAYFACISYVDAQIGRVLHALETSGLRENTIVVLYGDHGYHLGEQGLWGKTTNFELDTRVPLIVRAPGMKAAGVSTSSLVELVDLYPTLVELAGLPAPEQLEGKSFTPILDDPHNETKAVALSQYPRGGGLMGYSLRTPSHRLTRWVHRESQEVRATELYDYANGPVETKNIAASSPALVNQLSGHLTTAFAVSHAESRSSRKPTPTNDVAGTSDSTSFESVKVGLFESLDTEIGTWMPIDGRTVVDDKHARSGKQCLQLTGGEMTRVTLQLDDSIDTTGVLTFWAERWTKRTPFSFRIEKNSDDGWTEVYNGDNEVRVGRAFLSHVKVPLADAEITQLRFSVSSPANTGILIDDIQIAPARPQKIVTVEVEPVTLPALIGVDASALLKLQITTEGQLNPMSLTDLQVSLAGTTDRADILSLSLYCRETSNSFPTGKEIAHLDLAEAAGTSFILSCEQSQCQLADGMNTVWLACQLNPEANIDHRVGARAGQVTFSNGNTITLNALPSVQRLGVAVRKGGDEGVHTCRIPGLATTNDGTLIGVYDVRRQSGRDLPGDIDVGMSRSTDGGRTWHPMQVIMDMGDDPEWRYDGIGDPAVLVDRNSGTIWVAATWSHGNRSWVGSGQGLAPDETGQLMLARSDDDGVSWSKPINITRQVKKPDWCFLLQGPGKGITMSDGTIVFAAQYQDPPQNKRLPHSTIIYSRDHGVTWQCGTGAFDDTTESQVVEVEPGVLMLNCRYNLKPARVVMTTRNMGKTWQRHTTSERALIEPGACMASLIDVGREIGANSNKWLLFSNPDSLSGRHHITIKASDDRGLTWPEEHRLLLDEGRGSGYSCMSMIDSDTVGILYEGSQAQMTFQRVPLRDLTDDPPAPRNAQSGGSSAKNRPESVLPDRLVLPRVFADHMVLQADSQIPIWGHAAAGEHLTVTFDGEQQNATANANGEWNVRLRPRTATSTPSTMRIASSGELITLQDVLIGEVWVCAGQSNMEWPLQQTDHSDEELSAADRPELRLLSLTGGARGSSGSYTREHLQRLRPDAFCEGSWQVATARSARSFSAVAWYFGRTLQKELDVPVGLICPAVGGTPTESWISRDALASHPELKELVAGNWLDNPRIGDFCRTRGEQNLLSAMQTGESIPGDDLGPHHSFKPGFMWSAGIQPLVPYAMRGVIWYQGESNAETAAAVRQHSLLFPLLIHQWRESWGQEDFPFLYVQLPALNRPEWPLFRETQRRMLDQIQHVGMAVTIDTGHPSNVHPTLKKPVGERLAHLALGTTYGMESHSTAPGPLLAVAKCEGDAMTVAFDHVGMGLKPMDAEPLRHFEICGEDGVFCPATARITDRNTVTVSSSLVSDPCHVRYAWLPYPDPPVNLLNSVDLPASPFSTQGDKELFAESRPTSREPSSDDSRPNILLIVGEDHGCELSCYGDPVVVTPHIDRLASQGVLFENGYVTQSVCSPSRSTIFTGLYPHQNGQLGLATHQYSWFQSWPTTYSLLKQAGYRTGLIGKTHVNPAEAVEAYVDTRFQPSANFAKRHVADYAVKAGEFFRADDTPFFLTVNYPDAHWPLQGNVDGLPETQVDPDDVRIMPYIGGDTPRMRKIVRNYYDCMLRLDACVGQLLRQLDDSGKAESTLVIFIGDHGAQMARGKVTVYEGGLRVPYIVRWPDVTKPGHRSRALVSTIDLLPTFMDAAGQGPPAGLPGKSLRTVLDGTPGDTFRNYLVCERNCDAARHTFPQRTIRDARFKLIHSPVRDREDPAARYYRVHGATHWSGCLTDEELALASTQTQEGYERWLHPPEFQLYDLHADPHEWTDLSTDPQHQQTRERLLEALKQWQTDTRDPIADTRKLRMLVQENDAVFKSGRRSPKASWQYLRYLAP